MSRQEKGHEGPECGGGGGSCGLFVPRSRSSQIITRAEFVSLARFTYVQAEVALYRAAAFQTRNPKP